MSKLLYRVGDSLQLTYPTRLELRGLEVEVLKVRSIIEHLYDIRILVTGEVLVARENQIGPLEDGNQPSKWDDNSWRPKW